MKREPINYPRLRALLHYDPSTGFFTWLAGAGRWGEIEAGALAGGPEKRGYIQIGIDGRRYRAHRLAFLWMLGAWPVHEVDHVNGVKSDNRWLNLRDVSHQVNSQNLRAAHKKKSGLPIGTYFDPERSLWGAQIRAGQRRVHLGRFETSDLAAAAYLRAKRELHEGCTL